MAGELDQRIQAALDREVSALSNEFEAMLPPETIKRFVDDSVEQLSSARIQQFVPVFVRRLARERLLAAALRAAPGDRPGMSGSPKE